jgi:5-methylcytosine-specific restriction protein A
MASAPTRRCTRCRQLVQGQCQGCKPKSQANYDKHRGKVAERGYGARWQRARLVQLQREPLCRECSKQGKLTAASVVDHIVPHRGDQVLFWEWENWQSLCAACHNRKTARGE